MEICQEKNSTMCVYDVVIIGLGTMGSLTALELAKRGQKVIGFDSFVPPHDRGSHSGDTRIFRTAYAEHPNYVPLALRAGVLWDRLSKELEAPLLNRTGMVSMGELGNPLLAGIQTSAALHHLSIETLTASEVGKQFPGLRPPEEFVGILEKTAGWIDVNQTLKGTLARARMLGAQLELHTPVLAWESQGTEILVRTQTQAVRSRKLIITAGSWTASILKDLELPLTIKRKVLAWFAPEHPELCRPESLPVFMFTPNLFYGFPDIANQGVKVAEHLGGQQVLNLEAPIAKPDEADLRPLASAAVRFLPGLTPLDGGREPRLLAAKTCFYTMTSDEHFIIDHHPRQEHIVFAAGFSGHGFKFAPTVAEILSDLALNGKTALPIEFLKLQRLLPKN